VTNVTNSRRPSLIIVLVVFAMFMFAAFSTAGCSGNDATTDTSTTQTDTQATSGTDSGSSTVQTADAETILKEACSLCHELSRVYLASDATDWEATINKMIDEHSRTQPGSETLLTPEQEQAIIDFMKSRTMSAGELVVRDKCVECHDLTNITKQAQGTDWSSIIDRMVDEHGASLTEAEQQDALNFLRGE